MYVSYKEAMKYKTYIYSYISPAKLFWLAYRNIYLKIVTPKTFRFFNLNDTTLNIENY